MKDSKKSRTALVLLFLLFVVPLDVTPISTKGNGDTLVVMFYNVENFFDTHNDSITNDDDFLPDGSYRWTYSRYKNKSAAIARVILSSNGWNHPMLVGLCEVENKTVMNQLIFGSGLKNAGYSYIHFDSPDARGIDVALLYNRFLVKVLSKQAVPISDEALNLRTRDALYVKCIYAGEDTLHVVVNHWPSKRGGEKASEPARLHAATRIRSLCDSIFSVEPHAKIILMGDFNDVASSKSLAGVLGAAHPSSTGAALINLSYLSDRLGSHKFRGEWSCIDHIIVGSALFDSNNYPIFRVVDLPFLLEEDASFSGVKPFRTYLGPRYIGGYSDHLPVIGFIPLKK